MAIGPDDYYGELNAAPEVEWPGELPEYVEEWNELWFEATYPQRLVAAELLLMEDLLDAA